MIKLSWLPIHKVEDIKLQLELDDSFDCCPVRVSARRQLCERQIDICANHKFALANADAANIN